MVRYIRDTTGRFSQRPHFQPGELDRECEQSITALLERKHGEIRFPIATEDLQVLIESEADDLDCYADLSVYGSEVEGVTEFRPGRRPSVQINAVLMDDPRRENRLRTTLTHEYGHVHFHAPLFELEPPGHDLLRRDPSRNKIICKRDKILGAAEADWMEWQAGYVCGAILMPTSHVRRLICAYQEKHGLFGSVHQASAHGRSMIETVAEAFRVSQEAARIRLTKLGIIGLQEQGSSLFG